MVSEDWAAALFANVFASATERTPAKKAPPPATRRPRARSLPALSAAPPAAPQRYPATSAVPDVDARTPGSAGADAARKRNRHSELIAIA